MESYKVNFHGKPFWESTIIDFVVLQRILQNSRYFAGGGYLCLCDEKDSLFGIRCFLSIRAMFIRCRYYSLPG